MKETNTHWHSEIQWGTIPQPRYYRNQYPEIVTQKIHPIVADGNTHKAQRMSLECGSSSPCVLGPSLEKIWPKKPTKCRFFVGLQGSLCCKANDMNGMNAAAVGFWSLSIQPTSGKGQYSNHCQFYSNVSSGKKMGTLCHEWLSPRKILVFVF